MACCALVVSSCIWFSAGCLPTYELRPILREREVGTDFVFDSAEDRDAHPSRYFYEVDERSFGRLPRIMLEPRLRVDMTDNLDLNSSTADTVAKALTRVRIHIDSGRWHDRVNYRIDLQDSQQVFAGASGESDSLDIRQAYALLKPRRAVWGLRLGRMELDFGSGSLLGADWHDNLDHSFDGVRFTVADSWSRLEPRPWRWRVDTFVAKPVKVGGGPNDSHEPITIAGIFYGDRRAYPLRAEGLLIVTTSDGDDADDEVFVTLGGAVSAEHFGRARGVAAAAEAALQFGHRAQDEHFAYMLSFEGSFVFPTPWQVKLRGGLSFASGDDDPLDGRSGTFLPPFPGDMREKLGLLELVSLSNVLVAGVGISFGPIDDFRIGADLRWLSVAEAAAGYDGPDGTPVALVGDQLGRELDISGRYRFETDSGKVVWIEGGYSVFEPGAGMPIGTGAVQGLYVQTSFRF
jgi:hypothetical protein